MKPKEVKISKVLHLAADTYLAACAEDEGWLGPYQYTCIAIKKALQVEVDKVSNANYVYHWLIIKSGLQNLGFTDDRGIEVFKEFEDGYEPTEQSQGARYLWLKWAALMAEEQGE